MNSGSKCLDWLTHLILTMALKDGPIAPNLQIINLPGDTPMYSGHRVQIQTIQSRVHVDNKTCENISCVCLHDGFVTYIRLTSSSPSRTPQSVPLAFYHTAQTHHDFWSGLFSIRLLLHPYCRLRESKVWSVCSPSDAQSGSCRTAGACKGPVTQQIVRETMSEGDMNSGSFLCAPV